jgi:hypothetical protein
MKPLLAINNPNRNVFIPHIEKLEHNQTYPSECSNVNYDENHRHTIWLMHPQAFHTHI